MGATMGAIMRRDRLVGGWTLVVVLAVQACVDDRSDPDATPEPLPPPDARGEHIDVYLGEGARICPSTLERLDAEVERLSEVLAATLPEPEERIVLHYGDEAVKERCDVELEVGEFVRAGCTSAEGRWIAAQPGAESHELVHYLRVREELVGPPYWEEGLATYHGGLRPHREHIVAPDGGTGPAPSLRSALAPTRLADYAESAHFVAFLHATHGDDRLRTLSSTLAYVDPDAAFQQVLGRSLDDVVATWELDAAPEYVLEPACESRLVVGEAPVVLRGEIGCDVPRVIGPGPYASNEVFRGPLHCLQTPPDAILRVTVRGADDRGHVVAHARSSDACPTHDPFVDRHVMTGSAEEIPALGCEWSITYVSTLEGGNYEIELVLQ
jgi:hypothetical protein